MSPSAAATTDARVVQVARYLPQYRREFFQLARDRLAERGVAFELVHGQPGPMDRGKGDEAELPWATRVRNRYLLVRERELCWQPCWRHVRGARLVIIEQGTRLLANYLLFGMRPLGGPALAFWGHGAHVRPHAASSLSEQLKAAYSRRADWWFAYTPISAQTVVSQGFPQGRITLLQNAIDTRSLALGLAAVDLGEVASLRSELGVDNGPVGIFAGALYPEKRIGFLVEACEEVRKRLPDFTLVILGDGPDKSRVASLQRTRGWLKSVGAKFGPEKIPYFAMADVLLLPGAVGLAILDAFALERPLITTRVPFQGHEIAYLRPDVDGVIVEEWSSSKAYGSAVADLLEDRERLARLRAGCRESRDVYTVEAMAENFSSGVLRALEAGRQVQCRE